MTATSRREQNSIESVSVKNAMTPILWLCGLISSPAIVVIGLTASPSWIHITLALGPVGVAMFSYLFFVFKNPDRLQSESFQLRKQALELIEEKGSLAVIEASSIEVISNPDLPSLMAPRMESEE